MEKERIYTEKQKAFHQTLSNRYQCVVAMGNGEYDGNYSTDYIYLYNVYFRGFCFPIEIRVHFPIGQPDWVSTEVVLNFFNRHPVDVPPIWISEVMGFLRCGFVRENEREEAANTLWDILESECNKIQDYLERLEKRIDEECS